MEIYGIVKTVTEQNKKKKEGKKMKLTMTNEDYNSVFLQWIRDELEQKETFSFTLLGRDWNVCHYYWRDEDGKDADYVLVSVDNEFESRLEGEERYTEFESVLERKELYTLVETLTRFYRYEC